MKKRIVVTEKDIRYGRHSDPSSCPIALAANRQFRHQGVTEDKIYFSGGFDRGVKIPDKAATFIKRFDNHDPVEPLQFTIEVPDEYLSEG